MAILALVSGDDYKSALLDLRRRAGARSSATTRTANQSPSTDLEMAGAVTVMMKDAAPNLLQTLEAKPAFVRRTFR